jgi:hypothetical protein
MYKWDLTEWYVESMNDPHHGQSIESELAVYDKQ